MSVSVNLLTTTDEEIIEKARHVIYESLEIMLPGLKSGVSLTVCGDEYIRELNKNFRGKDAATDVLSFPLLSSDTPGKIDYTPTDIDPETGDVMLGDIVVSLERAAQQAEEYGHSLEREVCYLCVHSVLHLLGYDHMDDADKKLMRAKEEEILTSLNISR